MQNIDMLLKIMKERNINISNLKNSFLEEKERDKYGYHKSKSDLIVINKTILNTYIESIIKDNKDKKNIKNTTEKDFIINFIGGFIYFLLRLLSFTAIAISTVFSIVFLFLFLLNSELIHTDLWRLSILKICSTFIISMLFLICSKGINKYLNFRSLKKENKIFNGDFKNTMELKTKEILDYLETTDSQYTHEKEDLKKYLMENISTIKKETKKVFVENQISKIISYDNNMFEAEYDFISSKVLKKECEDTESMLENLSDKYNKKLKNNLEIGYTNTILKINKNKIIENRL